MLFFPVKAGNTNKVRVWISPLDCPLSVCKFVCLSGGWNKNYQPDFHEKLRMDKLKNWFSFVVHLDHFLFLSLKTGKCCNGLGRRWARCPFSYFIYTFAFPMWKCVGGENIEHSDTSSKSTAKWLEQLYTAGENILTVNVWILDTGDLAKYCKSFSGWEKLVDSELWIKERLKSCKVFSQPYFNLKR